MKNECCRIEAARVKDGYSLKVIGKGVKQAFKKALDLCCTGKTACSCFAESGKKGKGGR